VYDPLDPEAWIEYFFTVATASAALIWAIAGAWRFLIGVVDEQQP
jgi:hypothetical protein